MDFQVGDLVTLKHYGTTECPPPIAMVVSTECVQMFNRIQIQFFDTDRPEMAAPRHWKVVSRNEDR
jgi:hypothetical protein